MTAMTALPPTASHRVLLRRELERCPMGATVVEHGCGLYSTLLFREQYADFMRRICIESHPGWATWAHWAYNHEGPGALILNDPSALELETVHLLFIDGAANERVKLLNRALLAGVPRVIMHDTEPTQMRCYDLREHHFQHRGYRIEHHLDGERRTTLWTKE